MRRFKLNRKSAAIGAAVALALALGGVAFAYVTATGSGTGFGKVGTRATTLTGKLTVTVTACITPTKILPGETQSCSYKVHNSTGGQVKFTNNTVALAKTGTTIVGTAGKVAGCKFAWFAITIATQPAPQILAAGATTAAGIVHLKFITSASTTQNACLGSKPKFTITVPV